MCQSMKFGESLSDGLVPEWKAQYVDYKAGKKLIKRVDELRAAHAEERRSPPPTSNDSVQKTDDRTPLLAPRDAAGPDVPTEPAESLGPAAVLSEPARTAELGDSRLKRRTSIFNYTLPRRERPPSSFDSGKAAFTEWARLELAKVDRFYLEKELEAYERFLFLQDQLYQLREHKQEVIQARLARGSGPAPANPDKVYCVNDLAKHTKGVFEALDRFETPTLPSTTFWRRLRAHHRATDNPDISLSDEDAYDANYEQNRVRNGDLDETVSWDSDAFSDAESQRDAGGDAIHDAASLCDAGDTLGLEVARLAQRRRNRRDYQPKRKVFRVPYLYARLKLRTALLEHYRALTLLKLFRVLNRTALRKITKKFDKAAGASLNEAFMAEVDRTYFQTSDLVDKLIRQVEEMYVAFFDAELTDRKQLLEKLKSIAYTMNNAEMRQPTFYRSTLAVGAALGFGLPLFVLGVYWGLSHTLLGELPEGRMMLQIWGGFFLLVLICLLFGVNLMVFDHFKINYKFIFEFDLALALNYRQFLVMPAVGFAVLLLLVWFSFHDFWRLRFPGRNWPWLYFGALMAALLWPGPQMFGLLRRWLRVALWRLLLSGFYPVEFRDFFLGDILCLLTFTMGNLPFFFCLYAHHWRGVIGPGTNLCGSNKSRAMGFFAALPSVWRFLQCLRRYADTGDGFPHLANMGKFGVQAIYFMLLSIYRIDSSTANRVLFIVFAAFNTVYLATWDIVMDWSLLQSGLRHYLLRDDLVYRDPRYYYVGMGLNVLLRFQWVFYACFTRQIQQLAVTSFFVAVAEVVRRFIWVFFRMENEHSTNMTLFRASRDSPLPYKASAHVERAIKRLVRLRFEHERHKDEFVRRVPSAARDEEADLGLFKADFGMPKAPANVATASGLVYSQPKPAKRRMSTFMTVASALQRAHIKDFQRRKQSVSLEPTDDEDDDDEP